MPLQVPNSDVSLAWTYHNLTKHSEKNVRTNPHYLDWANQPLPFKIYTTVDAIPLPRTTEATGVAALSAISKIQAPAVTKRLPSTQDLARILYFSAGITKKKQYPGGDIYFRAASCTGALYEFELYIVCGDLPDLPAGVYHFGPGDYALRLLRKGDHRDVIVRATAGEPSTGQAPVSIVCTGTFWRNAWKYRTRTYRHFGWDNGTILANMLAITAALDLPATVVLGFVDADVNRLLDLDAKREVAFSLVNIGQTDVAAPAAPAELPRLGLPTIPLSSTEVEYPELGRVHAASSLHSVGEVSEWRAQSEQIHIEGSSPPQVLVPLTKDTIEEVILRRGSTRQFQRQPIQRDQLSTILKASTQGIWPGFPLLNEVYLIINAVEGVSPGAYYYQYGSGEFESLKEGDFRDTARYLGLQQDLPGDAAADIFFLANLGPILDRFGNRGYRAVQLEAGILGGKMYLASYALHLGATGLTFYDDDVTDFFSPHAKGKSAIFLVAVGRSRKLRPLDID
jgi:SagB-type dehydrogenase family enzyme